MDTLRGVGAFFLATCLAVFAAWLVAGCDKAEAPTVAPAAAPVAPASPTAAPDASPAVAAPGVPQRAMRYRAELIRNARVAWGLSAPVDDEDTADLDKLVAAVDAVVWWGTDLGAVVPNGGANVLLSGGAGFSVAEITYRTRYDIWKLIPAALGEAFPVMLELAEASA